MHAANAPPGPWPARPGPTPVAGPDALRTAVTRTLRSAGSELCLVLRTPLDERRLAPQPLLSEAAERGVRIRVLLEQDGANAGRTLAGADVRRVRRVPTRMLIADRRVALVLPPAEAAASAPGVAVAHAALLGVLTEHFELLWEMTARPGVMAEPPRRGDGEILTLLAGGLTDDAVAARVGSSARTVRRRVAALMREAGASTRFQAGVEAVRRGWL